MTEEHNLVVRGGFKKKKPNPSPQYFPHHQLYMRNFLNADIFEKIESPLILAKTIHKSNYVIDTEVLMKSEMRWRNIFWLWSK